MIAVSLTSSKEAGQKIDLFFSMYDRDQNGFIDINEMRDFVEVSHTKVIRRCVSNNFLLVNL